MNWNAYKIYSSFSYLSFIYISGCWGAVISLDQFHYIYQTWHNFKSCSSPIFFFSSYFLPLFYWKGSELQPPYDWREHGQLSPLFILDTCKCDITVQIFWFIKKKKWKFKSFFNITSCQLICRSLILYFLELRAHNHFNNIFDEKIYAVVDYVLRLLGRQSTKNRTSPQKT